VRKVLFLLLKIGRIWRSSRDRL